MNTNLIARAVPALAALLAQSVHEAEKPKTYQTASIHDLSALDDLLHDPVRQGCGIAIRAIGKELHARGVDLDEVASHVLDRAGAKSGQWRSIIAARWSGIGDWQS